jgi:hypothetical protein
MQTPKTIAEHAEKYRADAWKEYTPAELGSWVALLVKRAGMRTDHAKRAKDLDDAENYLAMLQEHINAGRGW